MPRGDPGRGKPESHVLSRKGEQAAASRSTAARKAAATRKRNADAHAH
jgi:hypothetical protein